MIEKKNSKPAKIHYKMIVNVSPDQLKQILALQENSYDANELIASLAVEIWRLEKRLEKKREILTNSIDNSSNSIMDQMQRIKDVFKRQEIEVNDQIGQEYNDGMSVKALHFEESDALPHGAMKIIETIKPSVYFKGQVISNGEVIVAKGK